MHHIRWCLHQWKVFLLLPNPGCPFFVKVLVDGPTGVGGTFFSAMHLLCHRARRATFSFLDSRLLTVPVIGAAPPPPLLGFCFLVIFLASFRLPFRVVTLAARTKNSTSLLDDDPQTWLSMRDWSVYFSSANSRNL